MKILVVEDDPAIREGVSELLSELGEVCAEGTVAEALACLREHAYALVITDLRIRGDADGGRKIALAARQAMVPVVIMSALSESEVRDQLRAVPPDALLPKPFQIEDVLQITEHFLSRRREADRCASLRSNVDPSTFTADPSGLWVSPPQAQPDRTVWWFRAPAGLRAERVTPAAELSVIVEGEVALEVGARVAGEALYASPEAKVAWTATKDVLGVTVAFRR